jgi:hypothetical protein
VRLTLGAVLLSAAGLRSAEVVYWEDLRQNPRERLGAVRAGEVRSAPGKADEASRIEERFRAAWADADVALESSRTIAARSAGRRS